MTDPLQPPAKKNPQKHTRISVSPPRQRSRAALGLAVAASQGRFSLQQCIACDCIQYPPRDVCRHCLSDNLIWRDLANGGKLVAETLIHSSLNVYYRERMPWRVGSVQLDVGPVVICHVHTDCQINERVVMIIRNDKAGQGVLMALPDKETSNMYEAAGVRELTSDPKFRRILITDGREKIGQILAQKLIEAEADTVFVGESENWKPYPGQDELHSAEKIEVVPLDVSDSSSVNELAATIGGKVDIVVNTARAIRPDKILQHKNIYFAQKAMDINALGLMRLAQAFAPVMLARAADGSNNAVAWVNILSVNALANVNDFGVFNASQAAALSVSQSLRAEFLGGGIKLMNAFVGAIDDEWHQPLSPPKVSHKKLAEEIVRGLKEGLEELYIGDNAKDIYARWLIDKKVTERELIQ